MGRKYDLIIFGASGFTGKYVVEEAAKFLAKKEENFTWAVSGRSQNKLTEILQEASKATGQDLSGVDKVIADVTDSKSLQSMASQAKIVLNCVGPYRFFGESVVKACVAEGTHHVDVSGEPQYLESMQLKYHKEAEEKGIYIIGACGLDSIPADCGVTYLQEKFEGDVNSVEMYLETDNHGKSSKIHYATWQSAIYGLAHSNELRGIRKQLFTEPLPKPTHKLPERGVLHYSNIVKGWCLPFPGADRSVVKRSQYHLFNHDKKRPAQMTPFVKQSSVFISLVTMLVALVFGVLAQFKVGRYLLENFPKVFSLGMVSHEGPTREEMDDLEFKFTLAGEGWKDKLVEPTDQHSEAPNKKLNVIVRGKNPGYGATCTMLLQAALTVLRETEKLPSKGGVYPPGAAFAQTSLVDRLNKNGVTFTLEAP